MAKKNKHKKHILTETHIRERVVTESLDETTKKATIADLKKTTILISLLFAVEFLIFYANLMGVGA